MSFQPYKSSITQYGDAQSKQLPIGWQILKLRYVTTIKKGKAPLELFDKQCDIASTPYLTMDYLRGNTQNINWVDPSNNVQIASNQEVLLLWDGSNAGEVIMGVPGVVSSTMALLYNTLLHQKYFFYVCKSFEVEIRSQTIGMGIPHVNNDHLKSLLIPFPPQEMQITIASFLDHETAKIDALVAEKQKLIELLKEKRQAVISHAVTKGLDSNAPMKNSGIEWLGLIPEHWQIVSLRHVSKRYSGGTPDKQNLSYWENGTIPWLNSGAVNQVQISEPSELITEEAYKNSSAKWIPKDALVIALAGQGKTKGMVAQLKISATCNQSMAAIIPHSNMNSRFLFWYLHSNYANIRNLASGEDRDGLNLNVLGTIRCPVFALKEQIAIAVYLDQETVKIDELIIEVTRTIELLQEKRFALMTESGRH